MSSNDPPWVYEPGTIERLNGLVQADYTNIEQRIAEHYSAQAEALVMRNPNFLQQQQESQRTVTGRTRSTGMPQDYRTALFKHLHVLEEFIPYQRVTMSNGLNDYRPGTEVYTKLEDNYAIRRDLTGSIERFDASAPVQRLGRASNTRDYSIALDVARGMQAADNFEAKNKEFAEQNSRIPAPRRRMM